MPVFEFDIGVSSHERLREHVIVDHWMRTTVEAPNVVEASEMAIQMGMCRGYVTECTFVV